MFFFLPIGVEGFKVRLPLLSLGIALACLFAFFATWVANPNHEGGPDRGELGLAVRTLERHPYLQVPEWYAKQYLSPVQRRGIEAMREEWLKTHAPPDAEVVEAEQLEVNRHFEAAVARLNQDPMRKWSFVPGRGLLQPGLITHLFLHFGWMHLFGNLLFFALCAPMLEDAWGRSLFGVFYVLGGLAAVLAHFLLDRHSMAAMAGASGAIAACMGAFAVRFARRRVLIAYFIFAGFRFFRGIWRWSAWVCGLLWFGDQVFEFVSGGSTGVAVMAHIGGFAFGAVVSFGMKAIGLEKDLIGTSEIDESPLQQSYSREAMLGLAALRQGDPQTARKHFTEVAAKDDDAALGLMRLDFEEGRRKEAMQGLETLTQRLLRTKNEVRAIEVMTEVWPRVDPNEFRPTTAAMLARVLDAEHTLHMALPLFERGGAAPGFFGIKSLLRAIELHLGRREGARADPLVRHLEAKSDHGPFAAQISGLRDEVNRLLTMHDAPVSGEHATAPSFAAPVAAAPPPVQHGPDVTECSLTALNDDGLVVDVGQARSETIAWSALVAVAFGVVPRSAQSGRSGGVLLVDLVVAWASESRGPVCFRFDSDSTALNTLFPAASAPESYRAFFLMVLQRADVVALPDVNSLSKGMYARYPSIEQRDLALFTR